MSHLITRRSFSAGLIFGVPAIVTGVRAAAQPMASINDPNGTGLDLESAFLRVSPFDLRDMLIATPFEAVDADAFESRRWEDIGKSPYFSSVGGVNILHAGTETVVGAYGIYLAPAGARAGQYLGRRALEKTVTEIVTEEVAGYAAEVLVSSDGELTQLPIGNVMVLGYDAGANTQAGGDHPSMANAELLVAHLHDMFELTR